MNPKNVQLSDADLMAKLRSRVALLERHATDTIYTMHFGRIQRSLLTAGCTAADAADAFQHAVAAFWINLSDPKFTITESIGAWLLTVAKRHWLNQVQRQQHLQAAAEEIRSALHPAQDQDDAPQRAAMLRMILAKIDPQCRKLLEMRFLQGYDREEIAEHMGYANVESVSNRLHTCRDRARQMARELGLRNP